MDGSGTTLASTFLVVMSKSDEYRANAEDCQRMSRGAWNPTDKATWLQMAEDWLRMIPPPDRSASDKFDAAENTSGTGQKRNLNSEH